MHNNTVNEFLKRNNINEEEIKRQISTKNLSIHDYNDIFYNYGKYYNYIINKVSIGDIIGYNYEWRDIPSDLFESLDKLFDANGGNYLCRSVPNLYKTPEEMLSSDSFKNEIMDLINLSDNNDVLVIGDNGIHRYTVLKILFLKELVENKKTLKELKDKYTVLARVSTIDRLKTYSNFIVSNLLGLRLNLEKIGYFQSTGNCYIIGKDFNKLYTDQELREYIKVLIKNNVDFVSKYSNNTDFMNFIENELNINIENASLKKLLI